MQKSLPIVALLVSMLIWSVSGIAIKHALAVLPPFTMIVLRFVPSVLLMFIIGIVRRKHSLFCLQKMDLKDLPLFLLAGTCQPFLYYLLETFTFDALNSPTIAETLLSTSPLLSPIFAGILLRERVTKYNILGILISTGGVFALTLIGATNYSIGNCGRFYYDAQGASEIQCAFVRVLHPTDQFDVFHSDLVVARRAGGA